MTSAPSDSSTDTARSQAAATSASTVAYPSVGEYTTRTGTCGSSSAASHEASGRGSAWRSVGSGPTATSRARATSAIRCAIGPLVDSPSHPGGWAPPPGTRPRLGFMPESPQQAEGMRMEPPPSDPVASGTMPAASAAAAPPEEPPGPRLVSYGLRDGPKMALVVLPIQPNSGVLVLPTTTQPAARKRATKGSSDGGGRVVGVQRGAVGRDVPDRVLQILHAERDAGQRPGVVPGRDALVERIGLHEGALAVDRDEGVVGRIEPLDPRQRHLGQLTRADLLGPHRARQVLDGRRAEVDVCHVAPAPSAPWPPRAQPADGERPAIASSSSMPIGTIAGAGIVMPLST